MLPIQRLLLSASAVTALATLVPAQTCLTTLFASNNGGSAGGAVYFDLTVSAPVTIVSLETNLGAASGTPVGLDVYMTAAGTSRAGNEGNPTAWTLMASDDGSATSAGTDLPTVVMLQTPFVVAPGSYGVALVARGSVHRYTNGNGANQSYGDPVLTIDLGSATNVPFAAPVFQPRVWNGSVCYFTGDVALARPYGAACGGDGPASAYQQFLLGTFDLSSTAHRYRSVGGSFEIVPAVAGIVAPVGAALSIGDDQVLPVTLPFPMPRPGGSITEVFVDSNGRVGFQPINSDLSESIQELLSGPATICAVWDDLNPAAGGAVYAEVDPLDPTRFHITWLGVPEFGGSAGSNDFQITLEADGSFQVTYGVCSVADCLVGYSPGNGTDGRAIDFSADLPLTLGTGRPPVGLVNLARPIIGRTAIAETRNIPSGATMGMHVAGFRRVDPPVDLTSIGAVGCFWHAEVDDSFPFTPTGSTASHAIPVPNDPSLAGGSVFVQTVVLVPGINAAGLATSNGLEYVVNLR